MEVLSLPNYFNVWDEFTYISSAETSQTFLLSKYEGKLIENPKTKSFDNCYPFIYYLEQGKSFFNQVSQSPINIKPILLFYGFVFLIKACILTVEPEYPTSTSVLAHGVSTRKKKKANFQYLMDEVKIQKNGLFPHFSSLLFNMQNLEGEKITIKRLFMEVPEMAPFLNKWEKQKVRISLLKEEEKWRIPDDILDCYKMTKERFSKYILDKTKRKTIVDIDQNRLYVIFPEKPRSKEFIPFRYNLQDQSYSISIIKDDVSFFYEMMIHYLILYHLSMIARYEVEWWAELINQRHGIEYPLIIHYLNIVEKKAPFLISQYLFTE